MIVIENVHKAFGPKQVLCGVSLTIPNGETMCIVGKSGCGKSVLLKVIVGLLSPDKGTVSIDGTPIHQLSREELYSVRRKIGFVFQGAALFDSLTVWENVAISLYEHGERRFEVLDREVRRVLEAVRLVPSPEEVGHATYEREYALLCAKKPSDLSGGMRKRVGVARALVGSPAYVLYDEPSTGLDPITSEQIDHLIKDLQNRLGVTSVVITHDMFSVFNVADRVAMLDGGVVRFEGSVEEFRSSPDPIVQEFIDRFVAPYQRV
ncbi:MAG: ATP-binding cassette domain-containing protein [Bacteroidota bacterium]|nr:ATP-binding cassette domain-containing protein [Candidatus Kapabacteria bacterium]MDW8074914.1 ATP-binding cassette domain-containing protein [Bacteroidota bacterium]MDW8271553.1 ATP-binding cassette domain-containing protein [Bacteroidota bacterium]